MERIRLDSLPKVDLDNCTKGGFGVYWGADHPWNGSYTIPPEDGPTNNKAELRAAIKAIEVAQENCIGKLTINSDSKYVISGVTQWSDTWYNKNSAEGVIAPAGAKVTGATIRMWLLNKFISFLAVLSWKTGLKKCRQSA